MPFLQNKVSPAPHLVLYWNGFFHLTTDRPIGMGLGPIPWSSMDRYAARHRITDPDAFELFVRFLRSMDNVFLADHAAKAKKN